MSQRVAITRRSFLQQTLKSTIGAGVASAFPTIVPRYIFGADAPSEKINIAMIGLGWRGNQLLGPCLHHPGTRVVAIADVDRDYLLHAQKVIDDEYDTTRAMTDGVWPAQRTPGAVDGYSDYRRILERKDVDAVMIATPDHWHAKIAIDAMDAGKDVYCEKPLTHTIYQGVALVRKQKETGQVFQTGSQQRSWGQFRQACEYVRNGRIGKLEWVKVILYRGSNKPGVPDEPAPPELDWNMWLGPAPYVPYNPLRCHIQFRGFLEYSAGGIGDFGAHHGDIALWGMNMDRTGPISIEGWAEREPGYFTVFTNYKFTYMYPNGIKLILDCEGENGTLFHGSKGEIFVNRDKITCTPESILKEPLGPNDLRLYHSDDHFQNWLDCIKSRKAPIADAVIGHRSATFCHLANICGRLKRKLQWDPVQEMFVNDPEANQWLHYDEREPFRIV